MRAVCFGGLSDVTRAMGKTVRSRHIELVTRSFGVFVLLCSTCACTHFGSFETEKSSGVQGATGSSQANLSLTGGSGDITHTARTRGIQIIRFADGQVKYSICAEPPPDVGEAQRGSLTLKLRVFNMGLDATLGGGSGDVPLTGRTGYLLLAREMNHWLCTAKNNLGLTYQQFYELYRMNEKLLRQVAATEAGHSVYGFKVRSALGESTGSAISFTRGLNQGPN